MKTMKMERILAIVLTLAMMVSMMLVFTVSGNASDNVYSLDVGDIHPFAQGAKDDADYEKAGTDNYFTVFYSQKTKVETNAKSFEDGFPGSQRISWGSKTEIGDQILNAVKFTTQGSATLKLWWVGGDVNRNPAIYNADGSIAVKDTTETVKNSLYLTEYTIDSQGTYYLGNEGGSNYFYKIEVTDNKDGTPLGDRADFATVADPVITSAKDTGSGKIKVTVDALIGHDGADELIVTMILGDQVIASKGSVTEKDSHTLYFTPEDSGNYSFTAVITRGEDGKSGETVSTDFTYLLSSPYLASATSKGGGTIELKWNPVHEAEGYNIYQDGIKIGTVSADKSSYTVSGLTIDAEYSFQVSAVRGNEELKSNSLVAIASAEAKMEWGFTFYGPSTSASKNGYVGSLNDDGKVTVYSEGGGGKIQPTSVDGLAFYYTAVPTDYNFTIRAKVSVDSWTLSNGQEGFGLIATDRLISSDDEYNFWNNSYLAGSTKIEYKYNGDLDELVDIKVVDSSLTKFSMKMGIGTVAKTGVTKDNIHLFAAQDTDTVNNCFVSRNNTLERQAADVCSESGTYNIIGNFTTPPAGTLEDRFLVTEYIMEIQKNNSGYYITHYAEDGSIIGQRKFYDPEALNQLDSDFVYVGFFASRNVRATFSDVEFSTILASEDEPREYPESTYVTPTVSVSSGTVTTKEDYELIVDSNVEGKITITYKNEIIAEDQFISPDARFRTELVLEDYDENYVKIQFNPDPDQYLGDFIELSSTKTVHVTHTVMFNKGNHHRKTLYISPDVYPYTTTADGTRENPFDIFTALEHAYPGQTLILMEGRYELDSSIKIQRGMDGTEDAPIRLIADPEAKTRPVLDFQKLYNGFVHGGNYWYFYGFDVTGSANMQKGFQVSGSYNVLDQIHTYENGNTGIQLSRLSGSDLYEDWPSYNLILNCTSYRNYDSGFEDADGFAAKLTIGDGNVFDGCIAYNNADDGWDLYAKVETGPIGSVTIRNCVSYDNGHVPGAGNKTGNGNGFKLGGESITGKHRLENCIAFDNLAKGIDSNSCPDVMVFNCISFNNGSHNVALYTNNAANTAFIAQGIISFRTENTDIAENLKGKGSQFPLDYVNVSTFYWNETEGVCENMSGEQITADMFVSLEFDGWERREDGTLDLKGFLEIKDSVPETAADVKLGATPSDEIVLLEDEPCSYKPGLYDEDKYAHWKECDCGNKANVTEHTFIWIIDRPVEGNKNGQKHEECVDCGYKKPAITIYPQPPVEEPDEPDEPTIPDEPTEPDAPITPEEPEELNFFEKFWQMILDFLKSIFPFFFPEEA